MSAASTFAETSNHRGPLITANLIEMQKKIHTRIWSNPGIKVKWGDYGRRCITPERHFKTFANKKWSLWGNDNRYCTKRLSGASVVVGKRRTLAVVTMLKTFLPSIPWAFILRRHYVRSTILRRKAQWFVFVKDLVKAAWNGNQWTVIAGNTFVM